MRDGILFENFPSLKSQLFLLYYNILKIQAFRIFFHFHPVGYICAECGCYCVFCFLCKVRLCAFYIVFLSPIILIYILRKRPQQTLHIKVFSQNLPSLLSFCCGCVYEKTSLRLVEVTEQTSYGRNKPLKGLSGK